MIIMFQMHTGTWEQYKFQDLEFGQHSFEEIVQANPRAHVIMELK